MLGLPSWFSSILKQNNPPFARVYDKKEAKEYYRQKKEKDEDTVFLTTQKGKVRYDEHALQGYKEILWEEQFKLHNQLREAEQKERELPSGSNFFVKLSGNSGKVNEARGKLQAAIKQLKAGIKSIDKEFETLKNLPILNTKADKVIKPRPVAHFVEGRAVNIFKEL